MTTSQASNRSSKVFVFYKIKPWLGGTRYTLPKIQSKSMSILSDKQNVQGTHIFPVYYFCQVWLQVVWCVPFRNSALEIRHGLQCTNQYHFLCALYFSSFYRCFKFFLFDLIHVCKVMLVRSLHFISASAMSRGLRITIQYTFFMYMFFKTLFALNDWEWWIIFE